MTFPVVPIQTRYPPENVIFEIADVTNKLNFEDASVDIVHARMTCINVRHFSSLPVQFPSHLHGGHLQPDAIPRFLREIARILRPGGLFLSAEWDTHPTLHPEHPYYAELEDYIQIGRAHV